MEIQISLLMDYVCTIRMYEHYQASSCAQVFLTIAVNTTAAVSQLCGRWFFEQEYKSVS